MWKAKGKAKKGQKDAQPAGTKEGKELIPLVVGNYLTHSLSNVTCMQIVRSNNNRRLTQVTFANTIFLSIAKAKSTLKSNIIMLFEKLNAKSQG